ncbi:flagellar basal body-associated protein FliL [Sediminibacillus albus]|uniref:Flagellar protein FliL n=1 Tax=Sediminibacillus albus TaxID=407036 RepID=A0A1G8W1N6_9BACI|nr:flagellar basal body-associated protein FliL [Sediminibacillus albus]SDJ72281.1 flagellar FliL protein [Sediminibacillus albus]
MSNKLLKSLVAILAVLTIAGAAVLVVVLNVSGEDKADEEQTLDEMVEYSFQTSEMNTDLEDGSFVRIQFQIITDSEKAKEEIAKREFQTQNILIKELASMDREAFKTGLGELEDVMKEKLNGLMQEGKVVDVYTINKVLQ